MELTMEPLDEMLASAQAMDDADAAWLWERSVELTGVRFDALTS